MFRVAMIVGISAAVGCLSVVALKLTTAKSRGSSVPESVVVEEKVSRIQSVEVNGSAFGTQTQVLRDTVTGREFLVVKIGYGVAAVELLPAMPKAGGG